MTKFIGNCADIIDWGEIIEQCERANPAYVGPGKSMESDLPQLREIKAIWSKWYKRFDQGGTVAWDMFFPGDQWNEKAAEKFWEFTGITEPTAIWISRIWPGRFAPIHWDVQSNEDNFVHDNYRRFHCHITPPKFGHFFVVDDMAFYNEKQGNVWEWNSRKSWHAGSNCGLEPKYLLNAFGI
jgi:hypothetical protein